MANEKMREALNNTIDNIVKKVEEAGSWIKPFKTSIANGIPHNISTHTEYNGMNVFNLWMIAMDEGYNSNEWLTFKQCKDLGGVVKKGEKSSPVFFFKPLRIKDEDEESGYKIIPMLKKYLVFNVAQTTLEATETQAEAVIDPIAEAELYYSKLDHLEVKTAPVAYYADDYIGIPTINSFMSAEEYYSTLGHEYIHSTGHKDRLDRDMSGGKSSKSYAFEELVAEIGSVLLMARLGIDTEPTQNNSAAYLKDWLKSFKDDKTYLWRAAAQATKAFKYLDDIATAKELLVA